MIRICLVVVVAFASACGKPDFESRDATHTTESRAAADIVTKMQLDVSKSVLGIDRMRSGFASSITASEDVDAETFARVCKPVGMQLKQTASTNGWEMRQIARKYRNPLHAPDPEANEIIDQFETDDQLDSLWIRTNSSGATGWRYFHRITVEQTCLSCHGARDDRPSFIKSKYPDDKAFDFVEGNLRGVYSVFISDSVMTAE